jgi:GT2 family glycosyltransferase
MHDLVIIVVSTNEGRWLTPCLRTVFEHAGKVELDVVVVDNESTDETAEIVREDFARARLVTCPNKGFSHANNRGFLTSDARYVLFLNPDTEIVDGTFEELIAALDERPGVGAVGVKQITSDGQLFPTIRRAPHAVRTFFEALASERFPVRGRWLGERELRMELYERETSCDWTSGSFLLVRREALDSAGLLDERFFLYAEETDLCLRIKKSGWEIRHLPTMTILHHAGKAGYNPKMEAQAAFAFVQYARKNFTPPHRAAYLAAHAVRYAIRSVFFGSTVSRERRIASRRAFRVLLGREGSPFGVPPGQALAPDARQTVSSSQRLERVPGVPR